MTQGPLRFCRCSRRNCRHSHIELHTLVQLSSGLSVPNHSGHARNSCTLHFWIASQKRLTLPKQFLSTPQVHPHPPSFLPITAKDKIEVVNEQQKRFRTMAPQLLDYCPQKSESEKHPIDDSDGFCFAVPVLESESNEIDDGPDASSFNGLPLSVPLDLIEHFQNDGFAVFGNVISLGAVDALNDRLEDVLRGVYDRGRAPDKTPRLVKGRKPQPKINKLTSSSHSSMDPANASNKPQGKNKKKSGGVGVGPIGFSGNRQNVKVLQIINIHKADSLFRKLETSPVLAKVVSKLAGWDDLGGARLAQDQVWAKPPGAPPLVFHRDSPYFMFEPAEVVTVWIALDDMDEELGPLEYVAGSHKWGDGRVGSANQFFQSDTRRLLRSAAEREGIDDLESLTFVSMRGMKRGGLSIHHGKIWHGSAKNASANRPRRGLGLHFVPASVRFTTEASKSRLWKDYVVGVEDPSTVDLSEEDFPLS